jgi:hypothetical protein
MKKYKLRLDKTNLKIRIYYKSKEYNILNKLVNNNYKIILVLDLEMILTKKTLVLI